jgi:hypothetical protein
MLIRVVLIAALMYIAFYYRFFCAIDRYLLSREDWLGHIRFHSDIQHQLFDLGQFPHFQSYYFKESNALFAHPHTAVLNPLNLLLPLISVFNFFICNLSVHYLIALVGFVLLRKFLNISYASILLMYVLFCFNGRMVSNYYVGHANFIAYMWFPLMLYYYFQFIKRLERPVFYSAVVGILLTVMFFLAPATILTGFS